MNCAKFIASVALAVVLAVGSPAHSTPITYTFAGDGAGTVNGGAFSGAFSFVFNADTTDIDTSDAPFFRLFNVGGTFTQGATNVTLTPTVTIVASSGIGLINFFNAAVDNGLGMGHPSLVGYDLFTALGPLTVPPVDADSYLTPTFGGGAFASSGGPVAITENSSLTFTAFVEGASAVPEPSTLALFGAGLAGLAAFRRRRKVKA